MPTRTGASTASARRSERRRAPRQVTTDDTSTSGAHHGRVQPMEGLHEHRGMGVRPERAAAERDIGASQRRPRMPTSPPITIWK